MLRSFMRGLVLLTVLALITTANGPSALPTLAATPTPNATPRATGSPATSSGPLAPLPTATRRAATPAPSASPRTATPSPRAETATPAARTATPHAAATTLPRAVATARPTARPAQRLPQPRTGNVWTQQSPATSPNARQDGSIAYDSTNAVTVLFGGQEGFAGSMCIDNGFHCNDTWAYDGTNWTQQSPTTSAAPRNAGAMAYDAGSGHSGVVLFGGCCVPNTFTPLADTWVWNGTTWTQQSPTTSPPGRAYAAMAYDSLHDQVVLFGGNDENGHYLADTWVWNGSTWTQQSPTTSPPGRSDASMAYDSLHHQIVLYGGENSCGNGCNQLNDTWTWDGTTWTQQTVAAPPARRDAGLAFDAAHGKAVLFGGCCEPWNGSNFPAYADTWTWDGSEWSDVTPATGPAGRSWGLLAYDALHAQIVLFGGEDSSDAYLSDTWTYVGSTLTPPTVTGVNPTSGSAAGGTTVTISGSALVGSSGSTSVAFGTTAATGVSCSANGTSCTATSPPEVAGTVDVTVTTNAGTSVTSSTDLYSYLPVVSSVSPTGGSGYGGTGVTIGGAGFSTSAGATVFSFGTLPATGVACATTTSCTATSPAGSGTVHVTATVNSETSATSSADQFTYQAIPPPPQENWTQVCTSAPCSTAVPPARQGGLFVNDAATNTDVLFGGIGANSTLLADTWTWDGTAWTPRCGTTISGATGACGPVARQLAALAYDGANHNVVLAGGYDSSNNILGDTWTWDGTAWTARCGTTGTSACGWGSRTEALMAFDGTRVILQGGRNATGIRVDTWGWSGSAWTQLCAGTSSNPCGPFDALSTNSAMTYDAATHAVVIVSTSPNTETYVWSGSLWTEACGPGTAGCGLPSVSGASTGYDPASKSVILSVKSGTASANVTYTWNGVAWNQLQPLASPPSRQSAMLADGSATLPLTLFGGSGASALLNDTWTWGTFMQPTVTGLSVSSGAANGGTTVTITGTNFVTTAGFTSVRFGVYLATGVSCASTTSCTALSPAGTGILDVTVTAGGQTSATSGVDQFTYQGTPALVWAKVGATSGPTAPAGSIAYDSTHHEVVYFGGCCLPNSTTGYAETWTWDGTAWTQLQPATSPPGRYRAAMAYDSASGQVVLYGGCCDAHNNPLGDTWTWDGTTWTQHTGTAPPAPAFNVGHLTMTYDVTHGVVVYLDQNGDTWTWNGTAWTEASTSRPTAYQDFGLAYDATTANVVLFGGCCDANGYSLGETSTWNGTAWMQLHPTVSPTARSGSALAFDGTRGQLMLFGGQDNSGANLNDTWLWDGTTWAQAPATTPTPPSAVGPAVYDSAHGQVFLYGDLSDAWVWYGGPPPPIPTVTGVSPTGGAANGGTAVTISGTNFSTAFGGTTIRFGNALATNVSCASATSCTVTSPAGSGTVDVRVTANLETSAASGVQFAYQGTPSAVWAQEGPFESPIGRVGASMAYDSASGQVVLVGGVGATEVPTDTWTWDGTTWTQQTATAFPNINSAGFIGAAMAYDTAHGQIVLFGGLNCNIAGCFTVGGTWVWNGTTWTQQNPTTSPPTRYDAMMSYDSVHHQIVLFGGFSDSTGTALNDTWTWDGTNWTQQHPATSPPGRKAAAMDFDAAHGTAVLFGGLGNCTSAPPPRTIQRALAASRSCSTLFDDTWTWDGTTWTEQHPTASPPGRYVAGMAYDSGAGATVLFGGYGISGALGDTWLWDGTNWSQQTTSIAPAARAYPALAYDSTHHQTVLFGGCTDNACTNYPDDTWVWYGTSSAPPPCATATLSASPASQQTAGTSVQLAATATGCPTPEFQYWVLPPSGQWSILQPYSTQTSATWSTPNLAPGSYSLAVWAKQQGSTQPYEAYQVIAYTLTAPPSPCTSVMLAPTPPTSAPVGTRVALAAQAAGCPTPQYEFWALPPGGSWTSLGAYSATTMATWDTTGLSAGTASLAVWVRDASSSQPYDTYQIVSPYTLTPICSAATLSALPASPQGLPASVTFTAQATPSSGATCQYEFWGLPLGGNWVVAQAYSTTTTFQWTVPAGTLQGVYQLAVWVEASGSASTTGYDSFAVIPYTLGCAVALAASPTGPANGANVTFTATTSGVCSQSLQYEWWAAPPSGGWGVGVAYPGTASLTVSSAGVTAGTWDVAVWLKAAGSSAAYDSYAIIPYVFNAPASGTSPRSTGGSSGRGGSNGGSGSGTNGLPAPPSATTPPRPFGAGFPTVLPGR